MAKTAEGAIDPVFCDAGYLLLLHEAGEVAAVAALFTDEEAEGGDEARIVVLRCVFRAAREQAPAAGAFAELELLDGLGDGYFFGWGERVGVIPW